MKKNLAFLGMIALCLASASCAKQLEEGAAVPVSPDGVNVTLSVEDAEWAADKSSYTPGQGIKLSKTERIALFYDCGMFISGGTSAGQSYASPAEPGGSGTYTFNAPEEALDKDWYAVVPYSKWLTRCQLSNFGRHLMLFVPTTQYPGQDTFDPATDLLVGKPFKISGTGAGKTATIDAFKRVTAPLKLTLTGLEAYEKVYAVTFSLSQKAHDTATGKLAGWCLYSVGENPWDFAYDGMQTSGTRQNAVSAIYDSGLSSVGGNFPVWFSVWPTEIEADCSATVTVFTADSCYTRTAPIPVGNIVSDKINTLSFNVKGQGYKSQYAISQGFFAPGVGTSKTESTVKLTATDGVERDWHFIGRKWTAAAEDGGSTLPDALAFPSNQTANDCFIEIPSVGKKVTKIRLYFAPLSHYESGAYNLNVCDGADILQEIPSISTLPQTSSGCKPGGYYDIECPASYDDMTGFTLKFGTCSKNVNAVISRIVLYLGAPAVDKNDYYERFLAGEDIVIGDQTYNINDEGIEYALFEGDKTYQNFRTVVPANDIVFVDNLVSIKGNRDMGIVLTRPRCTAIVGRYRKGMGQPVIDLQGKFFQANGGGLSLLNVDARTTDATHGLIMNTLTATAPDPGPQSYNVIDCTCSQGQYFIRESELTCAPMKSIIFDNSIFVINDHTERASFFMTDASKEFELGPQYRKLSITNCVFYCPLKGTSNPSFRMLVMSNASSFMYTSAQLNCTNLDVTFSNNTIYNIGPRYIVSAGYMKSLTMTDNVMYGGYQMSDAETSAKDFSICMVRCWGTLIGTKFGQTWVHPNKASSSIANNRIELSTSKPWVEAIDENTPLAATNDFYKFSNNSCTLNVASPTLFRKIDEQNVYFPVNGEGGATYDTKLWKKWE